MGVCCSPISPRQICSSGATMRARAAWPIKRRAVRRPRSTAHASAAISNPRIAPGPTERLRFASQYLLVCIPLRAGRPFSQAIHDAACASPGMKPGTIRERPRVARDSRRCRRWCETCPIGPLVLTASGLARDGLTGSHFPPKMASCSWPHTIGHISPACLFGCASSPVENVGKGVGVYPTPRFPPTLSSDSATTWR
jgi:hypothetical protein